MEDFLNIQKLKNYIVDCFEFYAKSYVQQSDEEGNIQGKRSSLTLLNAINTCDTVTAWLELFYKRTNALDELVRCWKADSQVFVKALGAENLAKVGIFNDLPVGSRIDPKFRTYYMLGHSEFEQLDANQVGRFLDQSKGTLRAGKALFAQESSGVVFQQATGVFTDDAKAKGFDQCVCHLSGNARGEFFDRSDVVCNECSMAVLRDDAQGTFTAVSKFYAADYSMVNIESPYVFGVLDGHSALVHVSSAALQGEVLQKPYVASPHVEFKSLFAKESLTQSLGENNRDKIAPFKDYLLGKSKVDPFYSGSVRELMHKAKGSLKR